MVKPRESNRPTVGGRHMDAELRSFLEEGFGQIRNDLTELKDRVGGLETRIEALETSVAGLETRLAGLEERMDGLETRITALETRVAALETRVQEEVTGLRTLIESVHHDVRLVADGHSVLFDAISRQSELFVTQLNDVRGMIRVWNDLMNNRIYRVEQQIRA